MEQLLQEHFNLVSPEIKKLDGYENTNYLISERGTKHIFKTYPFSDELLRIVNAENEVLLHLINFNNCEFPKPIAFNNGKYIEVINIDGQLSICRMLSFIDGQQLGNVTPSEALAKSLAGVVARLNISLQALSIDTFKARQWPWDLQYLYLNKIYISDISDARNRKLAAYFIQQFEEHVIPVAPTLRKQLIHNDVNEWNVLVQNNSIKGFIDFGDLAHSWLINEVAIAATYLAYDKEDPLFWISTFLTAYHDDFPLEENEIEILYYLIAGRLCTSACNAAHNRKVNPDNEYAASSEENAWSMLHKWLEIGPVQATNSFRKAAGFPLPDSPPIEEKLRKRNKHLSSILSVSYHKPITMESAAFQYMYDAYGNTYLDAYNNIPHVGHAHPKVVAAGQRQMAKLNTNTRYVYDLLAEYAEKLLSKFPKSLSKVFFVNSGSEASDLAIRMARTYTQKQNLMVIEHGYHGHTQQGIDISHYKFGHQKGQGQKDHILTTPLPDSYKGIHQDKNAGLAFANDTVKSIEHSQRSIAAFIAEPIVGCAGQVPLASGYLEKVYPAIRKQGGVCISDEVQTGFGRLGAYFWGFEMHQVVPDIVVLGKPMGNGHPIGAVICTDEIAQSFEKGVEFFSSFGGNPVSCAIGMAVLEVIEEEHLQQHAKEVGAYYKSLLKDIQQQHTCIGDVRGEGLFLGIEIVKSGTKLPDTDLARLIKNSLRERHILVSTDGPVDNVIKTKPPLCFTKSNAEQVAAQIDEILKNQ